MFLGKDIFMLSKQKSGSIRGNISISDFMRVQICALSRKPNAGFLLYKAPCVFFCDSNLPCSADMETSLTLCIANFALRLSATLREHPLKFNEIESPNLGVSGCPSKTEAPKRRPSICC